jgi:hypothetical protein
MISPFFGFGVYAIVAVHRAAGAESHQNTPIAAMPAISRRRNIRRSITDPSFPNRLYG